MRCDYITLKFHNRMEWDGTTFEKVKKITKIYNRSSPPLFLEGRHDTHHNGI